MTHTQAQDIAAILHKHGITTCPFQDNASVTSVVRLLAVRLFTNSFDAGFYASFDEGSHDRTMRDETIDRSGHAVASARAILDIVRMLENEAGKARADA